jgi:hypothetical protein
VKQALQPVRNERGIALVMALLVMVVVGILGAILMMTLAAESKLASYSQREGTALNTAEAGIAEACARIRNQDMLYSTANPREVAQIFNVAAGSVPVLGADSAGFATGQPAGQWLGYSTAGRSPDVLTLEFKTNAARDKIVRYDPTLSPPINLATGYPIYKITSTGLRGGVKRRIVAEVMQKPINLNIKGALTADKDISFVGNAVVCGYDHKADTHDWDGENPRSLLDPLSCMHHEQATGHLPGSWSTADVKNGGTAWQGGVPMANSYPNTGVPFYAGPWECLGLQQAEFWPWIGAHLDDEPSGTLDGIYYLDDDGVKQNGGSKFGFSSTTGEGMLYVDGDLDISSSFIYRGIVYVEGDLHITGHAWILGALIVKGVSEVKQNGGSTILYSSEAIQQALAKFGGQFVNLSWVESTP